MRYIIRKNADGEIIASGIPDQTVQDFEGNWYFAPSAIDMKYLKITDRTYTCSYKGTCFWVDLETPEGKVTNFGWVYQNPKPGYELIKDHIGVYVRKTGVTDAIQEKAE